MQVESAGNLHCSRPSRTGDLKNAQLLKTVTQNHLDIFLLDE